MDKTTLRQGLDSRFTLQIVIGMLLGVLIGLLIKWLPMSAMLRQFWIHDIFKTGGQIFISLIKMMVIPIVLVSLICGASMLGDVRKLGRVGGKAVILYLLTTAIAISLALLVAASFHIGQGMKMAEVANFVKPNALSIRQIIVNIFPNNIFTALSKGLMLQVIVFALLFGMALAACGDKVKRLVDIFHDANEVLMRLITMIMKLAPYGVFFLLAGLFAQLGFGLIRHLIGYFMVVLLVLVLQSAVVYTILISVLALLNPLTFFRKMFPAMLFAFSLSSSNASIPIVLKTVERRLGVSNSIASFIIPLGSTINMDGTAIMQGVATVFIANAYHINLGIIGYLTVIGMATLASIGTAGVPSVGLITLAMVLQQVGLPLQGVALIIGVDRLLDMVRTSVNITGDAMIACIVGKSEKALDKSVYVNSDDKGVLA